MQRYIYILPCLLLLYCQNAKHKAPFSAKTYEAQTLKYANGFSIKKTGDFAILEIKNPWPDSNRKYTYAVIDRRKAATITLPRDAYDGIILTPVERLVATSTTHLPALDLLGEEDALVGFPETDYVSTPSIRVKIDSGKVKELGKNEDINTEVLLEVNPELVVAFGVDGTNKTLNKIANANIAVIYNGDWVESSPLARAEWLKFFGLLFDKEEKANSIFNTIENNYLKAKSLASGSISEKSVLSGAMHKDVWYLPGGNSTEAQFFKDANLNYLWKSTTKTGSLALSFESVILKAKEADLWFSPSYYDSLENLENANEHYAQFKAFKNKRIYSFVSTKAKTGGVIYYELGMARPDLVLMDIINIGHPGLLPDYENHFFKILK